jgi:hypothetical protein
MILYSVICVNTLWLHSRSVSVHFCYRIRIPSVMSNSFLVRLSIPSFQYQDGLLFYSGYIIRRCLAHLCAVPSMDICIPVNSSSHLNVYTSSLIFQFWLHYLKVPLAFVLSPLYLFFQLLWSRSQIKGRITKFWSSIDFTSWSTSWLLSSIAHRFNFTVRDILYLCLRILYKYYSWWSSVAFCTSTDCCYSSMDMY